MKLFNIFNRRFIIILSLLLFISFNTFAVKAYRGLIKVTQPDGTSLNIRNNGDEFFKYRTTADGYLITQNSNGYYVYASVNDQGKITASSQVAKNLELRSTEDSQYLMRMPARVLSNAPKSFRVKSNITVPSRPKKAYPLLGSPKSLVILANFKDKSFSVSNPLTSFQNLCTQPGYSANGGTGSARDYFMASSYGKFSPNFVVVGPVTLPQNLSYYGTNLDGIDGNDENATQMIVDACKAADDAGVDFTQYDTDNDGQIDNVFVYYAGYNEAEGAASNTVWPHRFYIYTSEENSDPNYYTYDGTVASITFDGKRLFDYSCTSELKGTTGSNMCGVGTFCHEFGHVLGLPDFYHTNTSTYKATLETWDIMDYGPYLNDGRTPPSYSSYERFFLGFLTPEQINTPSDKTLNPLYLGTTQPSSTVGQSYLLSASTHNLSGSAPNPAEFFMLEYRKHTGWDKYLGQIVDDYGNLTTVPSDGMCIWHIDYDQAVWNDNAPNNYEGSTQTSTDHMRCYLQPLSGQTTTPGTTFTSGSFTPTSWSGTDINRPITAITDNSSNMTFKLMGGTPPPSLTVGLIEGSLVFPSTKSGNSKLKNINVKTTYITGNLTATLSGENADCFTVSSSTIAQATANSTGYNLTVTYTPKTSGSHTAVLTISGGDLPAPRVVNLSGTAY